MPQHYKRKTEVPHPTEGRLVAALDSLANGMALRKAAEELDISKSSTQRYQAKQKSIALTSSATLLAPNYQHAEIFPTAQEKELVQFVIEMAEMFHGYTYKKLRIFAYEMAVANNFKVPQNGKENKMASIDWHRNREGLFLRAPEPTSLARRTAFTNFNIETFF